MSFKGDVIVLIKLLEVKLFVVLQGTISPFHFKELSTIFPLCFTKWWYFSKKDHKHKQQSEKQQNNTAVWHIGGLLMDTQTATLNQS